MMPSYGDIISLRSHDRGVLYCIHHWGDTQVTTLAFFKTNPAFDGESRLNECFGLYTTVEISVARSLRKCSRLGSITVNGDGQPFFFTQNLAGRGKATHGQHTYCIPPGISMLSLHPFLRRQPSAESEFQPQPS